MNKSFMNLEVFNKRDGTIGTVVGEDEVTISIQILDNIKAVTRKTFMRWYTVVPQEQVTEDVVENDITDEQKPSTDNYVAPKEDSIPSGEPGIGDVLRSKFLSIVKDQANQELETFYYPKEKKDVIRYNGRNVFECTTASRRFNVYCHPLSLTPMNLRRASKIHDKSWGWSLRAKYIFTTEAQWPLMKTIIVDGLYYRQKAD